MQFMNSVNGHPSPNERIEMSTVVGFAGVPYPAFGSLKLEALYGLPMTAPLPGRYEFYDLAWAVAGMLTGGLGVCLGETSRQKVFRYEFPTFLSRAHGTQQIDLIAALLHPGTHHTTLHLSLADEEIQLPPLVLAVEDDEEVANLFSRILRHAGLSVATVGTGGLALQSARKIRPDLILLDVDLPDLSGFQVCTQLKADPELRAIPVIFCSGRHGLREHVMALGAVDCLEKPQDIPRLVERVLHWLPDSFRHQP